MAKNTPQYDHWIAVLQNAAKDGSVPDDEPSFYGFDLGRVISDLDTLAAKAGVPPLSRFYYDDSVFDDASTNEILEDRHGPGATFEDMDEDTHEMLPDLIRVYRSWKGPFFPSADGLAAVRGLRQWVAANTAEVYRLLPDLTAEGVTNYLEALGEVLEYGERHGRQFRLAPEGPA